jgi:hypothetical protein
MFNIFKKDKIILTASYFTVFYIIFQLVYPLLKTLALQGFVWVKEG